VIEGSYRSQDKDHEERVVPALDGLEAFNPAQGDWSEAKAFGKDQLRENAQLILE